MGTISNYEDLLCWQLSVQLRNELIPITARPRVRCNRKFCDQIGESARSAPANIAEGFDRSNREFLRYLNIALGSLRETSTHLGEALARKYVTPDEHVHFRILAKRAIRAAEGLKGYLEWRNSKGRDDEAPPPE
jgi:four helix bundle protein